ncbi:MAG: thioredoxin family protein, partial [Betaproteobacteria bacterium]
ETKTFDAQTFAQLQDAGAQIVVDVRADWCPTCKQQAPILAELMGRQEFKDYTILDVDFDTRQDVLKRFRVTQQSTLIVFDGKSEKGRSTGDTRKDSIAALLRKARG